MASELDRRPPPHERRVLQLAVLAGLPGSALGIAMLDKADRLGIGHTLPYA